MELELATVYQQCCDDVDLVGYLARLLACFLRRSDNEGMSYGPLKGVFAVKDFLNFTYQDTKKVHIIMKVDSKTKYRVTKAIAGSFPLRLQLLSFILASNSGSGQGCSCSIDTC